MLGVPALGDCKILTNGGIVGNSDAPGTSVPENATTLLYGTITELISAANNIQDSWGIEIAVFNTGASAQLGECSVDILVGASTEDVLISSLLVGGAYAATPRTFFFPVAIPAGTRIAARLANVATALTPDASVLIHLYGGTPPFKPGNRVTTYGTKINNARGVAVTPTASGGAATVNQIVAASTYDHFYFLPGFQVSTDTTIAAAGWLAVGIGIGASTEERIGTWWYGKSVAEHQYGHYPTMGAFRNVPAGTRLSLLISNGTANDAAHDGHIYAVS